MTIEWDYPRETSEQYVGRALPARSSRNLAIRFVGPRVMVATECPSCGQLATVSALTVQVAEWLAGMPAQAALAGLSAADRETLISGMHEACFDAATAGGQS